MRCKLSVGVWAVIVLAGCSNAGDDDDGQLPAAGAAAAPGVMMGPVMMGGQQPPPAGNGMVPVGGAAGGPVVPPMAGNMGLGGTGVMNPMAGIGAMGGDMGMAGMPPAGMGGMTAGMGGMAGMTAGMGGMGAMGGTMAGMGGTMMAGMGGTMAPTGPKSPCVTKGSQVVLIGDSYSNYIVHESVASLMSKRAVMNGAVGGYLDYAAAGTTLQNDGLGGIPMQWRTAKAGTKPIHVMIMDGGGNDVLIDNPSCLADGSQNSTLCKNVVAASVKVVQGLWADMKATGIKDVLYFWYPHIPGGLGGNGHDINDYGLAEVTKAAMAASGDGFNIYMIDTIPIFEGHPEYYVSDGIHATTAGTGKICDAIWAKMKEKCIGQPVSSGCCMP